MSIVSRTTLAIVFLTLITSALGGWLGVKYGLQHSQSSSSLDDMMHSELALTPEQHARIDNIEKSFKTQRTALLAEMRAADRELAAAMKNQTSYTPQMHQAVERFHKAMGTLQEATLQHVLAMRQVLTNEQTAKFDEMVEKALLSDTK